MTIHPRLVRSAPLVLLGLLTAGAFVAYFLFRQRYVGACDWFGYYELARLFREGRVALDTALPAETFPAIVPLGFIPQGANIVPMYPPGYPVLLALAGLVGAELLVNPLLGAVSIVVLYLLALDLTGKRWVGVATAAMWAFFPVVVFGSTTVMSDLTATVPVMAAYLLYRRGRVPWSALLLCFSLTIRPANILFCAAFAIPLLRDRNVVRYVAWMLPVAVPFALYNQLIYGAPWRTGYANIALDLTSEVFGPHLRFYLWETFRQAGPAALLAIPGLAVLFVRAGRRSEAAFFGLWFLGHLLFYSFWRSGGDAWWWTRFLLPAYVPLFLCAALGLDAAWEFAREKLPHRFARWTAWAVLVALVLWTPRYHVRIGRRPGDLWVRNKGAEYRGLVAHVEKLARPGSYVGSVEFAGSFRVYTALIPFVSAYDSAPELVAHVGQRGADVFLVVEPWNAKDPHVTGLLERFAGRKIAEDPLWGGIGIYQLTVPAAEAR